MSTLRDLQGVVVRVRRRPARRWKALGPYFRLSIGFSGVWRGPDGLRGASVHGTYICTDINDPELIINKQCYINNKRSQILRNLEFYVYRYM